MGGQTVNLKENGQKTKEENWWRDRVEEWDGEQKWEIDWHSFRGKMWQDKMSDRKKRTKAGRDVSKLGSCPPWYLSHSNLISPNRLHYCCCSPPLTRRPPPPITLHTAAETSSGRQICAANSLLRVYLHSAQGQGVPGWCRPMSDPSSLSPSSLSSSSSFPTHPSGALQRQDRHPDSEPENFWVHDNIRNAVIFTLSC